MKVATACLFLKIPASWLPPLFSENVYTGLDQERKSAKSVKSELLIYVTFWDSNKESTKCTPMTARELVFQNVKEVAVSGSIRTHFTLLTF